MYMGSPGFDDEQIKQLRNSAKFSRGRDHMSLIENRIQEDAEAKKIISRNESFLSLDQPQTQEP